MPLLGSVETGGGGWIRTSEAFASDLQSDPFGRSGTPPNFAYHLPYRRAQRVANNANLASKMQVIIRFTLLKKRLWRSLLNLVPAAGIELATY